MMGSRYVVFYSFLIVLPAWSMAEEPSSGSLSTTSSLMGIAVTDTLSQGTPILEKKVPGTSLLTPLYFLLKNNVNILPGYRCNVDLHSFALHKNDFFRRQYLAATNITMEADFFEIKRKMTFSAFAGIGFGLGEVKGNLVFTLLNTSADLALISRYRFTHTTASLKFNHCCYHDIDSRLFPVIFFNALRLGATSPWIHESDFWRRMQIKNGWVPLNFPAWSVEASYYIREFFGLVRPSKLNGFNDRVGEVSNNNRFAIYKHNSVGIALTSKEILGYAKPDNKASYWYWRIIGTIELHLLGNGEGATVYMGYGIDDMPQVEGLPRFSKDQLLQFGIRIMN